MYMNSQCVGWLLVFMFVFAQPKPPKPAHIESMRNKLRIACPAHTRSSLDIILHLSSFVYSTYHVIVFIVNPHALFKPPPLGME